DYKRVSRTALKGSLIPEATTWRSPGVISVDTDLGMIGRTWFSPQKLVYILLLNECTISLI
ncbi:MAG: hypothetical protein ACRD8Z_12605, partial [Nitrososphaeraceae archaeon]